LGRAAVGQELVDRQATGTSPGAIGSALAQQHLRSVMTGLGMILLGGEAYVAFKPNLIDEHGNIADETTKKFLADFADRFAHLVTRLAPVAQASARRLLKIGPHAEVRAQRASKGDGRPARGHLRMTLQCHIPSGPRAIATTPVRETSTRPTGSIRL